MKPAKSVPLSEQQSRHGEIVAGHRLADLVESSFRRPKADGLSEAMLRQLEGKYSQNVEIGARAHDVAALADELHFACSVGHRPIFLVCGGGGEDNIGSWAVSGEE